MCDMLEYAPLDDMELRIQELKSNLKDRMDADSTNRPGRASTS